jgi:hypothetical protein
MYCKEEKKNYYQNEEIWFWEELGRVQKMSVNEQGRKKDRLVHNATMCIANWMKINEKCMKNVCARIFPSISPQHIACDIADTQQTSERHKCSETLRTQSSSRVRDQKFLSKKIFILTVSNTLKNNFQLILFQHHSLVK